MQQGGGAASAVDILALQDDGEGGVTVIFAVARTVGWISQWNEMIEDPSQKIGRPRQLYTGYGPRPFVPVEKRRKK